MARIQSQIDVTLPAYQENRAAMLALVAEFRALEGKVRALSAARKARFVERGQLLPRDRVDMLLDRGTPFLEIATLAGYRMHDDDGGDNIMGGCLIAGVGFVGATRCMVIASDSAIKGGTMSPMGLNKSLRAQQIAAENKLPLVTLMESGGANLFYQAEIFVLGGRGFYNQSRLSAAGIPQVTVVHGSSTAGGAYVPGLSDYVVAVKGRARIFLAGPPLLKAATGEIADEEELGGAEMHTAVSGVADYLAEDDADAIRIARDIVAKLGWNANRPSRAEKSFKEPRYAPDELAGVVPVDYRKPYDVREVIARIVDDSDFVDFKPLYGAQTVCGSAEIHGCNCGILGNNGPIDTDGAVKAAQFIQLCCQAGLPLIFLQNTTGYLVGRDAEQRGIVKHGAKMIQAVANATVPKITLHIGASFGAGNYGMCGRSYDPRFIFAWPNNRIAVMGPEQAARTMAIVTAEKSRRAGKAVDDAAVAAMHRQIVQHIEKESHALYATARLWDDGLIEPRDSRKALAYCLTICVEAETRALRPNTFGVARM